MTTTTELAWAFLDEHPSIRDCLRMKVVNYSKLSRLIAGRLGIEKTASQDAILIACRRYAEKLRDGGVQEEKILNLLRKSKLETKNKIAVVIVDRRIYLDHLLDLERKVRAKAELFYAIEGVSAYTLIVAEEYLPEVEKLFLRHMLRRTGGLALVALRSPTEMESTAGVMAFLAGRLSEHGINVVETMSCWTDTMFVVAEADIPKALACLRF